MSALLTGTGSLQFQTLVKFLSFKSSVLLGFTIESACLLVSHIRGLHLKVLNLMSDS